MVTRLLKPHQQLVAVKYFTASVRNNPDGLHRQSSYLGALGSHTTRVEIFMGRFQEKNVRCRNCSNAWRTYEEKETDVSVAVSMVEDAATGRFDTALVVSADSDLCPAIRCIRRLRPSARVLAVFPPKRHSDELRQLADASFTLGRAVIRGSLLPGTVRSSSGMVYTRPRRWH